MKKRHENDYPTIVVGKPSDWILHNPDGTPVLDVHKQPAFDNDAWVAARKTANGHQPDGMCIGGSAASTVAGTRPGHENGCLEDTFKGQLRLYKEMRGENPIVEQEAPEELFRIGHAFEDAVATVAAENLNRDVFGPKGQVAYLINDGRMFRCGILDENGELKYPHAIADMDRILEVHDKKTGQIVALYGLEIKTANLGMTKTAHWTISKDNPLGVPEKYEVQCRHYMGVVNIDGFFIAVQEHSMKPSELLIRFIPRDIPLETQILDNEEAFVQRVLSGDEPQPWEDDPDKYMEALAVYSEGRQHNEDAFEFPAEAEEIIERYLYAERRCEELSEEYEKKAKPYQKEKSTAEAELSIYFEKDKKEYGTMALTDGRQVFVRQEMALGRDSYDVDAVEKDLPEIAERCIKKTIAKTGLRKADKVALEPYIIPGKPLGKFKTTVSVVEKE